MPLTVRKFKAKVRDSQTGNMIPAGLLSSDALEAIEDAKDAALDTIDDYVDAAEGYASDAAESAVAASENALTGNLAPQYDGTATYQIGDHVIDSNGILYRCNTTISSPQSTFVAAHWTQVKIGPQVDDIIKINQPADDGTKIRVVTSNEDVDLVTVEDLDDYVSRPEDDPNGTAGYVLRTNGDGTTQWADEARPTDTQTQNAVNAWMESHSGQYVIPDGNVTTAKIADEAITEDKLDDDLKLKVLNEYVTPQMFGAKGDGETDDSEAIQAALDSGKTVLFSHDKRYRAEGLIAPEKSIIEGNGTTIQALTTNNIILTIDRDSVINNIILAGINSQNLAVCGLKFSNRGYRINLNNIKISLCEYGVIDTNGIWSINIGKIWLVNCEHGFHIKNPTSTSLSIANFIHENCGSPLYLQYVNYSHIGVLCGDMANGGEESSWPYTYGHGTRNDNVYTFLNCKAISIDAMAGENNIGKYFVEIGSSDISISTIDVSRHTSYLENNRCLIKIREEISRVRIGSFMYYPNSADVHTQYDDFYDYPYNITAYGYPDNYLLRTVTGKISDRTPLQIIEPNGSKRPIRSNYSIYSDSVNITGKNALQLLFGYTVNRYTPLRMRVEAVLTDNASSTKIIKGDINGVILSNGVLGGLAEFTVQDPLSNGGQPQSLVVTKTKSTYTIEIPTGQKQAWITIESFCPRTEYTANFITVT